MDEIFGLDMNNVMAAVLLGFLVIVVGVGLFAVLNRIILKIGLRNIPRRPGQTALIIVGLMLSTLIVSSALGTGDTINFSIENEVIRGLGKVDEVLISNEGPSVGGAGSNAYFSVSEFDDLRATLEGFEQIDGILPIIGERAPVINPQTRQSAGTVNITAVDPDHADSFGPLLTRDSETEVRIADLRQDEIYLSSDAARELDAQVGQELQMFLEDSTVILKVKDIVQQGGLAGDGETVVMPLARAQEIFDKPGQINSILISNLGDARTGAELSEDVTEHLRSILTNDTIADQLITVLNRPELLTAIREQAEDKGDSLKRDLNDAANLIENPGTDRARLVSLLADDSVAAEILIAFEKTQGAEATFGAFLLFNQLKRLNVQDVKADFLNLADLASSGITSIFVIFGLFSMLAGVMLIFLIFVMLAAERRPEMGIARAVGMRRRHLVQSFVYEGLAYDLISALVGAVLGIGVGFGLVTIMASIFASDDEGFQLIRNYTPRSFVVAYCVGVVLTFATVFFSAYRASKLNIVSAIRNLQEEFADSQRQSRIRIVVNALIRPFIFLTRVWKALIRKSVGGVIGNLALVILWVGSFLIVWIVDIVIAIIRSILPSMSQGWPTFGLGVILIVLGLFVEQTAPYTIGVTFALIGVGQAMRRLFQRKGGWSFERQTRFTAGMIAGVSLFWLIVGIWHAITLAIVLAVVTIAFEILRQAAMRRERTLADLEDRNAYTFIGLSLILFWGTPFDTLDFVVPELGSNIEMFFVSGVAIVTAAVWVVVYNADLITSGMTAVFGRYSRLRPSLKTAVAYPLSSRIRTGLTLAMLSLIIFTLIVMSVLTTAFGGVFEDIESVTGGWDIVTTVSTNNPIEDIETELPAVLGEDAGSIEAVGGYTTLSVEARQPQFSLQWDTYRLRGGNDAFLENSGYEFRLIANGFGETKDEVWQALRDDPSLAVIDAIAVPQRQGGGNFNIGGPTFSIEGFFLDDDEFEPTPVEIRDPQTGKAATITIIGVLDVLADQAFVFITGRETLGLVSDEELPITTYRFKTTPTADVPAVSRAIESGFLANGAESTVLREDIEKSRDQNIALNRLLQGFMASGLLVGIAALGVISLRAVVERRQQIGVLKAIGYRESMILVSFLMESSFVALLGIILGVALGTLLSFNLVSSIEEQVPGIRFSVPWLQVGIIMGIAYAFSLLTTFLPARQASRIYPAQALRYE